MNYLFLFTNIFFVKGYTRTMVLDIQKEKWIFIDNDYYDIILQLKKESISSIKENLDEESIIYFEEFIKFILDNDYGALVDDISIFPEIEEYWDSPYEIDNVIIDLDKNSDYNIKKVAKQLQKLNCQFVEIRYFGTLEPHRLERILVSFKDRDFRFIHIISEYGSFDETQYFDLALNYINIAFTIYNSPENKLVRSPLSNILPEMGHINYISQNITDCSFCGIINEATLIKPKEVKDFMENKLFNSCLNRKISIDINGNIKNCPSMKTSFGHIDAGSLIEASKNAAFQKKWHINKDRIDVCKDCEYRYVCSDCRAYTKDEKEFGKPLKCGYNPYIGEWAN